LCDKLIITLLPSSSDTRFVMMGCFDNKSQTHEEVVVALRGINEEVHRLAGTVIRLRLFHLVPELLVFGRTVRGIHFKRTGVDGSEEIEAQLGLGRDGEGKGQNAPAKRLLEEGGDGLTDTGGIDDDTAAAPDVFQEVDKLGVEFGVAATGPAIMFNNTNGRLTTYGDCGGGWCIRLR
jgi:hypothetical protein